MADVRLAGDGHLLINDNFTGIHVPEAWVKELDRVPQEQYKKKATEMTIKLLKELAPMCQGIHFMLFDWSDIIPEVLAAVRPIFSQINSGRICRHART